MIYMKHIILKKIVAFPTLGMGLACLIYTACSAMPSPLYGTWADNMESNVSFFDDGTFNAKIIAENYKADAEGNYSVLRNVLTLIRPVNNKTQTMVTEWDIRGNILYFVWTTEDGKYIEMRLFKILN